MIGASVDTHNWTCSPASLTLLLSDFRLGEMPRPFEAVHPYTTLAERDAFRARCVPELTSAGVLRSGDLRPAARQSLSALVSAPVGIVVMGTLATGQLLARGCWQGGGAVLARERGDHIVVSGLDATPLVDAMVALIPDAEPARGSSVTLSTDGTAGPTGGAARTTPSARAEEKDTTLRLYDDFDEPAPRRTGTPAVPATMARMFRDPIIGCGAFVPFARGTFLPPVT